MFAQRMFARQQWQADTETGLCRRNALHGVDNAPVRAQQQTALQAHIGRKGLHCIGRGRLAGRRGLAFPHQSDGVTAQTRVIQAADIPAAGMNLDAFGLEPGKGQAQVIAMDLPLQLHAVDASRQAQQWFLAVSQQAGRLAVDTHGKQGGRFVAVGHGDGHIRFGLHLQQQLQALILKLQLTIRQQGTIGRALGRLQQALLELIKHRLWRRFRRLGRCRDRTHQDHQQQGRTAAGQPPLAQTSRYQVRHQARQQGQQRSHGQHPQQPYQPGRSNDQAHALLRCYRSRPLQPVVRADAPLGNARPRLHRPGTGVQ